MASPQSSQPKRPPQLSRTVSRALRTLGRREDIQCTRSLIQAYNTNDTGDEMGIALNRWLEAYVEEFSERNADCMRENWIREYALLATVNVKTSEAAEMQRRVYISLRSCIKIGEYCSPIIVVAVENILRVMDRKVIERETQSLVSLANDLLCLTDPEKCIYTRDTYPFHMACLLTLERVLIVLHGIECAHSKQWIVKFFQKKFRTQLKTIAAKQKYYPFVYNTQLIKYNIDRLVKSDRTDMLMNAGRRAFYALCGGLYLIEGITELGAMRLNVTAIERGVHNMHQAFGGLMDTKVRGLQEVMQAVSESKEKEDFTYITECYEKHKYPSFWDRIVLNKLKIIKFALISHMTLFAVDDSSSCLPDQAFRLLSRLAVNDDTAHWRVDPDIYECLLDALASIGAKKQTLRQECLQLLYQMEKTSIRKHQTLVKDWRGFSSIEQMLDMECDESENPVSSLFDNVRKRLGLHLTHARDLELKQELIEYYQTEKFAKVSLLLDDVNKQHIADLDFHLVEYEWVNTKNPATRDTSSTHDDDQMAYNLERSQRLQKTIKIQEIFAKRRQKPSGPEEEVSRILLLGSPGTGKTSLSKRLCFGWSTCGWGSQFYQVYLLPIRQLTRSRLQSVATLEGAISELLFNSNTRSEDERNALHHQIKDELADQTTLLMLDGLDEANGNDIAERIAEDALSRSCSILVLSRPHNLGDMSARMEIQVECLGLNDDQLRAFVQRGVLDSSVELIKFLKRSPMVWELAHIPINAQILCTLWSSEVGQGWKELESINLKTLYSTMVEYVWKRFEEKATEKVDRRSVFSSLESIAFKSMSKGLIEIPREFVMLNPQDAAMSTLLDSGFLLFHMEGQVFQFAHLSFHEFFTGQFLAKALQGTEKEVKEAKKYIAERKYYDTSRVTLSFMTQCFCKEENDSDEEDCIERLKQLLSILDEDPIEVLGFQHLMLKMRTLDAFLSVCGSCAQHIRSDDDLEKVVQPALVLMGRCLRDRSSNISVEYTEGLHLYATYRRTMENFGRTSSLFAHLPNFLFTALGSYDLSRDRGNISEIARLVNHAPEQLLRIVPMELRSAERDDIGDCCEICLLMWLKLFANSSQDGAILGLDKLKTACQDQRDEIRRQAFGATPYFLEALPDRQDLHSLCLDAMKDTSTAVRFAFIKHLGSVTFEANSAAAYLAWTLTVEATMDKNEQVRHRAFLNVVREDQTSEASIEKMIELLLDFMPVCVAKEHRRYCTGILEGIAKLLGRFPTKLSVFLPYLASCCNDLNVYVNQEVQGIIKDLSSSLPFPQLKELGEMIARIYSDVKHPDVRKSLVVAIYNIGQSIPDFMTKLPDVFSKACNGVDEEVREMAQDKMAAMKVLISAKSVDGISKVFWDQSYGIKKELLNLIQRERMISSDTADVVLEMAVNCLESRAKSVQELAIDVLLSLRQFRSLSSIKFHHAVDYETQCYSSQARKFLVDHPLDILLEYFWSTSDERIVGLVAVRLVLASVTYKACQGGLSIVSVLENGKNTQQRVPNELVEKLITRVKNKFRPELRDVIF